jgi:hypothetical protein
MFSAVIAPPENGQPLVWLFVMVSFSAVFGHKANRVFSEVS